MKNKLYILVVIVIMILSMSAALAQDIDIETTDVEIDMGYKAFENQSDLYKIVEEDTKMILESLTVDEKLPNDLILNTKKALPMYTTSGITESKLPSIGVIADDVSKFTKEWIIPVTSKQGEVYAFVRYKKGISYEAAEKIVADYEDKELAKLFLEKAKTREGQWYVTQLKVINEKKRETYTNLFDSTHMNSVISDNKVNKVTNMTTILVDQLDLLVVYIEGADSEYIYTIDSGYLSSVSNSQFTEAKSFEKTYSAYVDGIDQLNSEISPGGISTGNSYTKTVLIFCAFTLLILMIAIRTFRKRALH